MSDMIRSNSDSDNFTALARVVLAIVAIRAEFVLNRDVSLFLLVADRQESTRDWCVSSQSCTVSGEKMNNPSILLTY